jgi:hypothetical protein
MALTSVQSNFSLTPAKGHPGMVGDGWHGTDIDSVTVGEGGAKPGLAVVRSTSNIATLPAGNLTNIDGVVVAEPAKEGSDFVAGDTAPVLKKGRVWVKIEDAASGYTLLASPYVRHTADGQLTQLGAFSASSGTGLSQWTAVKVTDIDLANNVIEISINSL